MHTQDSACQVPTGSTLKESFLEPQQLTNLHEVLYTKLSAWQTDSTCVTHVCVFTRCVTDVQHKKHNPWGFGGIYAQECGALAVAAAPSQIGNHPASVVLMIPEKAKDTRTKSCSSPGSVQGPSECRYQYYE